MGSFTGGASGSPAFRARPCWAPDDACASHRLQRLLPDRDLSDGALRVSGRSRDRVTAGRCERLRSVETPPGLSGSTSPAPGRWPSPSPPAWPGLAAASSPLALFVNFESFTFGEFVDRAADDDIGRQRHSGGPVVGTATLFLAGQGSEGFRMADLWLRRAVGARAVRDAGGDRRRLARLRDRTRARLSRAAASSGQPWPRFPAGLPVTSGRSPGQATLVTRDLTSRFGGLIAVNAVSMVVRSARCMR